MVQTKGRALFAGRLNLDGLLYAAPAASLIVDDLM